MKTTLFVLFLLCTTAALAQSGITASSISAEPQVIRMPSHDLSAAQHPMAVERNILFTSSNASGRGERPLWEVGAKPPVEVPLGDIARQFRGEHATAKKAVMVLEK